MSGASTNRKSPSGRVTSIYSSQTISPASLAALATIENTVTVAGAAVGDVVSASPRTGLQSGLVLGWCRVSAANTVKVAIGNMTAGALVPTSQVWDIRILKA
jgi:hypothetical protein